MLQIFPKPNFLAKFYSLVATANFFNVVSKLIYATYSLYTMMKLEI